MDLRYLAAALIFIAWPAWACTDGVDCMCDTVGAGADIIWCEDFENPTLDNGGLGWQSFYGSMVPGCNCSSGFMMFPRPTECDVPVVRNSGPVICPTCCIDIITEAECHLEPDCVFDGTKALGMDQIPQNTSGVGGGPGWASSKTWGMTLVRKFTTNYLEPGSCPLCGPAHKMDELFPTQDSPFGSSSVNNPGFRNHPWPGTVFRYTSAQTSQPGWNAVVGAVGWLPGNPGFVRAAPFRNSLYTWETTTGHGKGDWICYKIHYTDMGTVNSRFRAWVNDVLVIDIQNLDSRNAHNANGVNGLFWNNYYNGFQNNGYAGPSRAWRYQDNMIATSASEPITCAAIGFGEPADPAVSITKTPTIQQIVAGATASFTVTTTNIGGSELTNVVVADPFSTDCAETIGTLAISASNVKACTETGVAADFTNEATVTTDEGPTDSALANVDVIAPAITITVTPPTQTVLSGAAAEFNIALENTGDVALDGIAITAPLALDCQAGIAPMAIGATFAYDCSEPNVTAGFTMTATVVATAPAGPQLSENDDSVVSVGAPDMMMTCTCVACSGVSPYTASYDIDIENTGGEVLSNVTIVATDSDCNAAVGTMNPTDTHEELCSQAGLTESHRNSVIVTADPVTGGQLLRFDVCDVAVGEGPPAAGSAGSLLVY